MGKTVAPTEATTPTAGDMPAAQVPGELPPEPIGPTVEDDGTAARIAELEATVAQQNQIIAELSIKAASAPPAPANPQAVERVVGNDWANRTAAEAQAAGLQEKVLCRDGWYVPGG